MNLVQQYDAAIARGEINDDPLQRELLSPLQRLADELNTSKNSWFSWLSANTIKGIYIYGPVGVGKTYLVDMFYDAVDVPKKARFHFHHFMQQIDMQLRKLQGQKDPLRQIAKTIAKTTRLLCFDEFLVHDVAYAMILVKLLPELIAQKVILVISSNSKPDELYWKGVQRDRFLPIIALLKQQCEVLFLNDQVDYRLGRTPLLDAYLYPLNEQTHKAMQTQFALLGPIEEKNGVILVQNREIPFLERNDRTIWFVFTVICDLPRSQLDYLEISDRFDTIFVSNVPILTEKHTTQAIMFIHFIDVMYDRGIKVIISAAVPVNELYVQGEMVDAFKRTKSRLERSEE
ncbi:MAG: cell division protein ZapE, partial [Legionella sp.]